MPAAASAELEEVDLLEAFMVLAVPYEGQQVCFVGLQFYGDRVGGMHHFFVSRQLLFSVATEARTDRRRGHSLVTISADHCQRWALVFVS